MSGYGQDYSPLSSMNQEAYCDTLRKRLFEEQMKQVEAVGSSAEYSPAFQRKIDALQKRLAECTAGGAKTEQQVATSALGGLNG